MNDLQQLGQFPNLSHESQEEAAGLVEPFPISLGRELGLSPSAANKRTGIANNNNGLPSQNSEEKIIFKGRFKIASHSRCEKETQRRARRAGPKRALRALSESDVTYISSSDGSQLKQKLSPTLPPSMFSLRITSIQNNRLKTAPTASLNSTTTKATFPAKF